MICRAGMQKRRRYEKPTRQDCLTLAVLQQTENQAPLGLRSHEIRSMTPFAVRELTPTDTHALLDFETRNRGWFESHIEPRDPAFYSMQGVADHIESYLSAYAAGRWHPFVIAGADQTIVGRANLKDINHEKRTAEVGYRIDQDACGQGLATIALKHLIVAAQQRWNLTHLVAYAYPENVGSRKVLDRCGFLRDRSLVPGEPGPEERFVLVF